MRKLASALGLAVAATLCVAAPALAQPPHVIVRGAIPIAPPPEFGYDPGDSYYDSPAYIYGEDPLDRYYDPAGKVPYINYSGPKAVDLALAQTLDVNHESILGHILHCQARYTTYNPATNMYWGRNGIPTACEI